MSQLPKGWVQKTFDEIAEYTDYVANGSFATLKENVTQTDDEDYAILLRLRDHSGGFKGPFKYVTKSSYEFLKKSDLRPGDLFLANVGAPGRTFLVPDLGKPMTIAPNGIRVRANSLTSNRFIEYFIRSRQGQDLILSITGGNAQQKFNKTALRKSNFPLPPLADQKRIADKLDSVLAKIEAAQARLDKIPTILKRFRQSVLAAATSGELTKDWREENGVNKDWEVKELKEVCNSISDGDHQAPPKAERGIPFLVISNVSAGYLNFDSVSRWVPQEYYDSLKNIRKPEKGDILYTVTGSFGIPIIVNLEEDFCFQRHIAIIKPNTQLVDTGYLKLFLESPSIFKHATKVATGTAQKTVSLTNLRKFKVGMPSRNEQVEISDRVNELFEHANTVEKQYKAAKARLDKLTQSILAKAFRGELVSSTNAQIENELNQAKVEVSP